MTKRLNLGTCAGIVDDSNVMWFSSYSFNGLFSYDLTERKMTFICCFDYMPHNEEGLHIKAEIFLNYIVFFPYKDSYVRLFNKQTCKLLSYRIPNAIGGEWFYEACITDGKMYFVSSKYEVYIFDLSFKEFISNNELNVCIRNCITKNTKHPEIIISNDSICIADSGIVGFYQIDLLEASVKEYILDKDYGEIYYIACFEDEYWLLFSNHTHVICLSPDRGCVVYQNDDMKSAYKKKFLPYSKVYFVNGEVWFSGYYTSEIYRVNKSDKKIDNPFFMPRGGYVCEYPSFGPCFGDIQVHGEKIYILPQRYSHLIEYDMINKSVVNYEFDICDYSTVDLVQSSMKKGMLYECPMINLIDFIEYVSIK